MKVKLNEIPYCLLSMIRNTEYAWPTYNGIEIKEIFYFDGKYRINTVQGQFRVKGTTEINVME